LRAAPKVEVFLRCNVVELRSDAAAKRIEWLRLATLDGNGFRIAARVYVLAAGGIENARLLLASSTIQPNGIGNAHDLVGRYFMDHWFQQPAVARVVLDAPAASVALYAWPPARDAVTGRVSQGRIVLSDELQRQHRLPNNGFGLLPLPKPGSVPLMRAVGSVVRDFSATDTKAQYFGDLSINLEPLPDAENRVTLGDDVDALGMPKSRLHWNLTAGDRDGALRSLAVFATELGRSLRGRVRVELGATRQWRQMSYSAHHIGTTRMHADPKQGVVDANCRVHEVSNLYVAGSSVFPTSGLVNPTLTIVALAIRLGDHLKSVALA
jgi:choline dehydrogenase-like flavoprotein